MTHHTDAERAEFEAVASDNGKWPQAIERDAKGNYLLMTTAHGWMWWQAARRVPVVSAVPQWKVVPVEPTEKMISEGSCAQTLEHGHRYIGECAAKTAWSFMLAAAPKPPEAAPAQEGWCDGCSPDNCCGCGPNQEREKK